MQFYFKYMIKDLVSFLFNVNIAVLSNVAKKKVLNYIIEIIKYYWLLKSSIIIKTIFF